MSVHPFSEKRVHCHTSSTVLAKWQKTIVQFWYWLFAALPAVAWSGYTELKAYGDITALNLRTNRPGNVMPVSKARELRRAYWAASSFADNQVRCLSSSSPLFNTLGIIRIYQYFLETKTSRLGGGGGRGGVERLFISQKYRHTLIFCSIGNHRSA